MLSIWETVGQFFPQVNFIRDSFIQFGYLYSASFETTAQRRSSDALRLKKNFFTHIISAYYMCKDNCRNANLRSNFWATRNISSNYIKRSKNGDYFSRQHLHLVYVFVLYMYGLFIGVRVHRCGCVCLSVSVCVYVCVRIRVHPWHPLNCMRMTITFFLDIPSLGCRVFERKLGRRMSVERERWKRETERET